MHKSSMSSSLTQVALVFSTLLLPFWACTQTHNPLDDWSRPRHPWSKGFRDSLDLERGQLHIFPDSSGFFYFRVDTSLSDLRSEMRRFFHFGPSERDFFLPPAFREFDRMFEQFFRSMPQLPLQRPWPDFPADDGQMKEEGNWLPEERLRQKETPEENNHLLPEERLRLEERKNAPNKKKPAEPTRQTPDVKTIRI